MSIKSQDHSLILVKGHSDFKVKCLIFGLYTQVSDSGPQGPLVLFSIGGKKVYEPFSLSVSLSLTHTHTYKCNLSYFPYITHNVRSNAIQNIRVQNDKNHHNTKNTAKTCRLQFIYLFFFKFVACAVPTDKNHGRQMLNGYKACSL